MNIRQLSLLFFFTLQNIHQSSSQPSPNHKTIQLIGSTRFVSLVEEATRNFCSNYWCTNDAFYLFTKSSQYVGVDPCVDFKNFTVNHVEEVDHPDDRQLYRGFQSIVQNKYLERLRQVLAAKIDLVKDTRVVKVMKNSFKKCLKSPHLTRHLQAHKDMIKYLQSFGGSPYLSKHTNFNLNLFDDDAIEYFYSRNFSLNLNKNISDELWNENDFDLKNLFENESHYALKIFLGIEVKRCSEGSLQILCLKQAENRPKYDKNETYDFISFKELFNELDDSYRHPKENKNFLIDEIFKPTFKRYRNYYKNRDEIEKNFNFKNLTIISIKDLREKLRPDFDIDWLKIINSQLLERSQVDENEEILIKNGGIEMLQELVRNLVATDKKTLADTFVSTFLYANRHALILRFLNQQQLNYGIKHGFQRWQRCIIDYHRDFMYPAHIFMYEQERLTWDRTVGDFDRDKTNKQVDIPEMAEKFIQEAVDEFKLRFKKGTDLKPSIAIDVLNKLKTLKIVISLQSKIFTAEKLEEFYDELQLNGDEEFLESAFEMRRNHRRLLNEPNNSWRRQIDRMVYTKHNDWITYNIQDGNILYIPPMRIIYPLYHPHRPKFFNMATTFRNVITTLHFEISDYIKKKFNIQRRDYETGIKSDITVSYEHYRNWLRNHTDLVLGANLLTHRQLFWVAVAVQDYVRFQKGIAKSISAREQLQQEYYHVWYKQFKGFQEAFQCNITLEELEKYIEFLKKFAKTP